MPIARVSNDLEMHYLIDDYTDPWDTPETILLLHGSSESGAMWFGWVPHLARQFRVVRPDMRGFGRSTPMPRDYAWRIDDVVDDFANLMQQLGIERFHLVGAKIAGTIARRFAAAGFADAAALLGAAHAGDARAVELVDDLCRVMGRTLYNVVITLDLQRISMGGSVFWHHRDYLLPRLRSHIDGKLGALTNDFELVEAGLGERVGDYAALALVID